MSEDSRTEISRSSFRWYGHMMRSYEGAGIRRVLECGVEDVTGRGRPRLGWRVQVEKDRVKVGFSDVEASNRCEWRSGVFRFH